MVRLIRSSVSLGPTGRAGRVDIDKWWNINVSETLLYGFELVGPFILPLLIARVVAATTWAGHRRLVWLVVA